MIDTSHHENFLYWTMAIRYLLLIYCDCKGQYLCMAHQSRTHTRQSVAPLHLVFFLFVNDRRGRGQMLLKKEVPLEEPWGSYICFVAAISVRVPLPPHSNYIAETLTKGIEQWGPQIPLIISYPSGTKHQVPTV